MQLRAAVAPHTPDLPAALEHLEITELAHDASFAEAELVDAELSNQQANGVAFDATRLANVELAGSRLNDLRLTDTVLRGCNLANVQMQRAEAIRVSIDNSRLTGIHLSEGTLRDLSGCRVNPSVAGWVV